MEFEAGRDALAAGRLPEIGHRGCNLEGTVELLFGAECIVSHRIVADGCHPCAQCGAGRQDVELDRPFIPEDLGCSAAGTGRQPHQRDIARRRGRLTECFGHRIGALKCHSESPTKRNRLFEGRAESALIIGRVDTRVHTTDARYADRCPRGPGTSVARCRQRALEATARV